MGLQLRMTFNDTDYAYQIINSKLTDQYTTELELMLDYKKKELRDLDNGEGRYREGGGLNGLADDIQTIKEQVDTLENHLRERERTLDDLKRQIQEEKAGR